MDYFVDWLLCWLATWLFRCFVQWWKQRAGAKSISSRVLRKQDLEDHKAQLLRSGQNSRKANARVRRWNASRKRVWQKQRTTVNALDKQPRTTESKSPSLSTFHFWKHGITIPCKQNNLEDPRLRLDPRRFFLVLVFWCFWKWKVENHVSSSQRPEASRMVRALRKRSS